MIKKNSDSLVDLSQSSDTNLWVHGGSGKIITQVFDTRGAESLLYLESEIGSENRDLRKIEMKHGSIDRTRQEISRLESVFH